MNNAHRVIRKSKYFGYRQDADAVLVHCPKCGYEYSHVERCCTRLGYDQSEAQVYEGTIAMEATDEERRSAIVIQFHGECGHNWKLVIQQHKGVNFAAVEMLPDTPEEML